MWKATFSRLEMFMFKTYNLRNAVFQYFKEVKVY